jgi:HEAT repeat protein
MSATRTVAGIVLLMTCEIMGCGRSVPSQKSDTVATPPKIDIRYDGKDLAEWRREFLKFGAFSSEIPGPDLSLRRHPSASAIPLLLELAKDQEPFVRSVALVCLGDLHEDAQPAIPQIASALSDPDPGVRLSAARTLGEIGPPSRIVADRLLMLLRSTVALPAGNRFGLLPNSDLQLESAKALIAIGHPLDEVTPALCRLVLDARTQEQSHIGKEAIIGNEAIKVLCRLKSEHATIAPFLMQVANDKVYPDLLRAQAIAGLGAMEPPSAEIISTLTSLVEDRRVSVRVKAAISLWHLKKDARLVLPALIGALKDADSTTYDREQAIDAIVKLGKDAAPALKVLSDVKTDDRNELIRAKAEAAFDKITSLLLAK